MAWKHMLRMKSLKRGDVVWVVYQQMDDGFLASAIWPPMR